MKNLTKASVNELSILVHNDQQLVDTFKENPFKFMNVLSKNYQVTKEQFDTMLLDLLGKHPQGLKERRLLSDFEVFKEQLKLEALPIIEYDLNTCMGNI